MSKPIAGTSKSAFGGFHDDQVASTSGANFSSWTYEGSVNPQDNITALLLYWYGSKWEVGTLRYGPMESDPIRPLVILPSQDINNANGGELVPMATPTAVQEYFTENPAMPTSYKKEKQIQGKKKDSVIKIIRKKNLLGRDKQNVATTKKYLVKDLPKAKLVLLLSPNIKLNGTVSLCDVNTAPDNVGPMPPSPLYSDNNNNHFLDFSKSKDLMLFSGSKEEPNPLTIFKNLSLEETRSTNEIMETNEDDCFLDWDYTLPDIEGMSELENSFQNMSSG